MTNYALQQITVKRGLNAPSFRDNKELMQRIAIIGTAGRKGDKPRMSKELYWKMYESAYSIINQEGESKLIIVSGGAAWADHLAVSLYMREVVEHLYLFLPAEFRDNHYIHPPGADNRHPAAVSNYYHQLFSRKIGGNTLRGLGAAITKGAVTKVIPGFKNRNLAVGNVDIVIAYTWGTGSIAWYTNKNEGWKDSRAAGLKPGGTLHTWNNSAAPTKIHVPLGTL